jgi:SAM-dependent methyltransferase
VLQAASDLAGRPVHELRVLDLGCNEGLFAIEFARQGAAVVGIEGREEALVRARFVKDLLQLERLEFHRDDVRNLSEQRYGRFDVVLCVGLLYHLNEPDVLELLSCMASVCDRIALVHTHISTAPVSRFEWRGHSYWGRQFLEHLPDEHSERASWASLGNATSFWLTRASLVDALQDSGFTTVAEVSAPFIPWQPSDHVTLAAIRGARVPVRSVPGLDLEPWCRWPERRKLTVHPGQKWYYAHYRRLLAMMPAPWRSSVRRMLRATRTRLGMWWARPEDGSRS